MKNNLIKILIVALLLSPFILRATTIPMFVDDSGGGGTGTGGTGGGGGGGGTGGSGGGSGGYAGTASSSSLFVSTGEASDITYTTAVLHGSGGDNFSSPTLPLTAYFRYSTADISPIYCNDIYGTNMQATGDVKLGVPASGKAINFSQKITGLAPDTLYYYCAIVSNKQSIGYGGTGIVKSFHTNPYGGSITTNEADAVTKDSAKLNGYYSSTDDASVYFEYRKWTGSSSENWKQAGGQNYQVGNNSNIYGDFSVVLSGFDPNTTYQYRAVITTNKGGESGKTIYGNILNFTTEDNSTDTGTGGTGDTGTGGGKGGSGIGGTGGSGNKTGTGGTGVTGTGGGGNYSSGGSARTGQGGGTTIYQNVSNGSSSGRNSNGGYANSGSYGGSSNGGNFYGNNGGNLYGGSGQGNQNYNTKITDTTPLALGQTSTPPALAIVHYMEGVETVFARQITADTDFAKKYGYTDGQDLQAFAWYLADELGRAFGYVDASRKEIRVSAPDVAAYQLQLSGGKLSVYEYYLNKIVDVRSASATFKTASGYEYYFKR